MEEGLLHAARSLAARRADDVGAEIGEQAAAEQTPPVDWSSTRRPASGAVASTWSPIRHWMRRPLTIRITMDEILILDNDADPDRERT